MMRHLFAALAVAGLLAAPAAAHDGDHPPDMRVWKDAEGLFEIEASFVFARDGQVRLLKHDGSLVWVPLAKLSAADRAWVQQRTGEIQRLNGVAEPVPARESATQADSGAPALPVAVGVFALITLAAAVSALRRRWVATGFDRFR